MLATKLKDKENIRSLIKGKVFTISCRGCKEVGFPEEDVHSFIAQLGQEGCLIGRMDTDYICNPENLDERIKYRGKAAEDADTILVFSCGVGVQTVADKYPEKRVAAACDTYALPGFQGVTPPEHSCAKCGQCFLNITGGICPVTACSKSLINGQCGGSKDGKCEVDPSMECGWERIERRLEMLGRKDILLNSPVQVGDYTK